MDDDDVATLLRDVSAAKVGDRNKALDRLGTWIEYPGNRLALDSASSRDVVRSAFPCGRSDPTVSTFTACTDAHVPVTIHTHGCHVICGVVVDRWRR